MAYDKYPTARDNMKSGKWTHLHFYRRGLSGIHYYANRKKNGKYNLIYVSSASELGWLIFGILKLISIPVRLIFNIVSKNLGGETFDELIDEIDEGRKALRHNDSSGNSVMVHYDVGSIEECRELMYKDIKRKLKKVAV